MSEPDLKSRIERVHASGRQLVLSITGGGSRAISTLLEVPGASATVIGAIVPYAATALEHWLGGPVDHYCSERTARAMAMGAFQRARGFSQADPQLLRGIGATASLVSLRPKRGPHRIHVAWQSADTTVALSCELTKGDRTRIEEEEIACRLVLTAVFEACGVEGETLLAPEVAAAIQRCEQVAPLSWSELLLGERDLVQVPETVVDVEKAHPDGSQSKPRAILFPGAFNPLHTGHERMAELASARFGMPTTFELSITNVDKPPLDFLEIADRLQHLPGRRVLLTRAPTFVEKARLVPESVFVVGIDTLRRIAEPRYYGGDATERDGAISTIAQQGCRFLVFGRSRDGNFLGLRDLDLPPALRDLCDEVPEPEFRADISSTELRR